MTGTKRLDQIYAALLKNHDGWALFQKVDSADLRPGALGFFDSDGIWKPIAQVLDASLTSSGWKRPETPVDVKQNSGRIAWEPKSSSHVRRIEVSGEAGGTNSFTPGEVSASFKIEGNHDRGAVLLTEAPITREMVCNDEPLLRWVEQNSARLLQDFRHELKEHGLWLVTKTYLTRRCVLSVLHSKTAEVTIGLRTDISGLLTWAPGAKCSGSSTDVSTVTYEDDCGVVVFMCGYFITKRWDKSLKTESRRDKQKMLRAGQEEGFYTIITTESDGSKAILLVEPFTELRD